LRHALDCDLVAVTSRTLSQSARAALSFELLFVRSIAGPPCVLQSLFPARLQLAADSRRPLRQPSCASNLLSRACAQPICFGHSVDPYVCRVFRNALGFPLAFSRVKRGFHRLHARKLTNSPTFADLFSQDKAVKLYPMLNLPGLSEIDNLRCRSSQHFPRNLLDCDSNA